jgi:peptidoglycan/LPS O-acetylase OafA/YrhL
MNAVATLPNRSTLSKTVLLWLPTFVGFPLGGLAAKLIVGSIDGIAPATAGGAITGIVLGVAQWLGMRRTGPSRARWIGATAVGVAVGVAAGAAAVGYHTNTGALATQGVICGAVLGVAQATVLYRTLGHIVWAWPATLAGLWALGWTITASAGIDVETHYTVFGASGALVVTAATAILPTLLEHRQRRSTR